MPITLICVTDHTKHRTFKHEPDAEKFTGLSKWQLERRIRATTKNFEIHVDGEVYIATYGDPPKEGGIPSDDWENELQERQRKVGRKITQHTGESRVYVGDILEGL